MRIIYTCLYTFYHTLHILIFLIDQNIKYVLNKLNNSSCQYIISVRK